MSMSYLSRRYDANIDCDNEVGTFAMSMTKQGQTQRFLEYTDILKKLRCRKHLPLVVV